MRLTLILLLLLAAPVSAHIHEHAPDFSAQPKAVIVQPGETLEVDSLLCVSTLVVHPGGTLVLHPGADIVFLDVPFHDGDHDQIGNGLIMMGDMLALGTPKTPVTRSLWGIPAGATTTQLDRVPDGWQVGDVLEIPDTRQRGPGVEGRHTERVTITEVCGGEVRFTPTRYDHPVGTRDWQTPHVANLSRDVLVRSENPSGRRGHIMVMGQGYGTWQYMEIRDLGRTDATRIIGNDNVNGRYPLHWHLMGSHGDRQYAEGVVVDGSRKWCYTVHGTSNVELRDCIGTGAVGATFVTEDGHERHNTFLRCYAANARSGIRGGEIVRLAGDLRDFAREGSGFWSRLAGNHFIECIAADVDSKGFSIDGQHLPTSFYQPRVTIGGTHLHNESYATSSAFWVREHVGGTDRARQSLSPRLDVRECVGWNLSRAGAFVYRTTNVHIDNCHWYADPVISARNPGEPDPHTQNRRFLATSKGFAYTEGYPITGCSVTNSSCEGFNIGVFLPPAQFTQLDYGAIPGFTMTDVHLSAAIPIYVPVVKNEAMYRLTGITWTRESDTRISPQPRDGDIWMNTGGRIIEWPRPSWYRIWINGERYFYPDEPAANRVEREGVVGLVEASD